MRDLMALVNPFLPMVHMKFLKNLENRKIGLYKHGMDELDLMCPNPNPANPTILYRKGKHLKELASIKIFVMLC